MLYILFVLLYTGFLLFVIFPIGFFVGFVPTKIIGYYIAFRYVWASRPARYRGLRSLVAVLAASLDIGTLSVVDTAVFSFGSSFANPLLFGSLAYIAVIAARSVVWVVVLYFVPDLSGTKQHPRQTAVRYGLAASAWSALSDLAAAAVMCVISFPAWSFFARILGRPI